MNGFLCNRNRFFHAVGALLAAGLLCASLAAAAQVPLTLEPPAGNVETVRAYGVGVQIYLSAARKDDPTKFEWVFKAPEATLYNHGGHVLGRHYAGPTWESANGSKVVGARVASAPSSDPNAIPWLLLKAVSHEGHGMFSEVTYVQRLFTTGGKAPAAPPTQANLEVRIPYTATYVFFEAAE